jgi:2-desacetyl-2-hydroxyethyl bacteriochlorophyllide A dehydrogenase
MSSGLDMPSIVQLRGRRAVGSSFVRALTFDAPGRVALVHVPDPTLLEPADVVVATEVAGLCGSDLHVYRGLEPGLDPGTPMGHELLGTVVAAGSEVSRFRVGDRVVAPFSTACGSCFFCDAGLPARCERGQLFGWVERGRGLAGCQAELVRVPLADSTLVAVPGGVAGEEALLAGDVLSTGWFGAANGDVRTGSVVAVVGCGAVGISAVAAAITLGAERVLAIDPAEDRRRLAERFGGQGHTPDDAAEHARVATAGRGVDVVVEAVGSPQASRLAFDLVRAGGTISAVGVHHEPALAIAPGALYDKNLTYRAGRCPARAYLDRSLRLIESGRFPFGELVSHRLPLASAVEAYAAFDRREVGWSKVVFRMG